MDQSQSLSFGGVTVHIGWSKGQALLKMEVNQQAKAAGVHGRAAMSTFGVGTCGDNLCAHTHAPQGIMASGGACGSALMSGEGKEARTAEIVENDTRGEADIEWYYRMEEGFPSRKPLIEA